MSLFDSEEFAVCTICGGIGYVYDDKVDATKPCVCQADLSGTQVNPVARAGDPSTSHMAAASIPTEKMRERQKAVLVCLTRFGPMTDEEIALCYPRVPGLPEQSPSGLRTRRSELHYAGHVVDTGGKRELQSGRLAIVWGLPDAS